MQVKQFYNKNQFLIEDVNDLYFQSYNSMIARIKDNIITLGSDWDYSKTTLKHLYLFINDYYNMIDNLDYNNFINSKNKKQYIQKLIDNEVINIDYL